MKVNEQPADVIAAIIRSSVMHSLVMVIVGLAVVFGSIFGLVGMLKADVEVDATIVSIDDDTSAVQIYVLSSDGVQIEAGELIPTRRIGPASEFWQVGDGVNLTCRWMRLDQFVTKCWEYQ